MADFYDITDWQIKNHLNTKGTRNKHIAYNSEDNNDYYFKTSMVDGNRLYYPEFWSEIIVYEVGNYLGFDVLKYDVAKYNDSIGCISKSMTPEENWSLVEGISFLTHYDNSYDPNDKKSYSSYTFDFIEKALINAGYVDCIDGIIETIILDAIFGNSDRHQENWGILTKDKELPNDRIKIIVLILISLFNRLRNDRPTTNQHHVFSPIYDSGCCLARECNEQKVEELLKYKDRLEAYINRGKAEIRWDKDRKLNHFELVRKVKDKYNKKVTDTINRVKQKYNKDDIYEIVRNIDSEIPKGISSDYTLSDSRKELIYRIIDNRCNKLIGLL